ncbi:MAG: 6-pyruvoyl trahydropterin synthase family protein [Terriglobales bacterium]
MAVWRLGKSGFRFNASHSFPQDDGYDRELHGHDYDLTVWLEGERAASGMLYDLRQLKALVAEAVIAPLDHSQLNALLPDPSAEALAEWIWRRLRPQLPAALRLGIRLEETRTTTVEYWG